MAQLFSDSEDDEVTVTGVSKRLPPGEAALAIGDANPGAAVEQNAKKAEDKVQPQQQYQHQHQEEFLEKEEQLQQVQQLVGSRQIQDLECVQQAHQPRPGRENQQPVTQVVFRFQPPALAQLSQLKSEQLTTGPENAIELSEDEAPTNTNSNGPQQARVTSGPPSSARTTLSDRSPYARPPVLGQCTGPPTVVREVRDASHPSCAVMPSVRAALGLFGINVLHQACTSTPESDKRRAQHPQEPKSLRREKRSEVNELAAILGRPVPPGQRDVEDRSRPRSPDRNSAEAKRQRLDFEPLCSANPGGRSSHGTMDSALNELAPTGERARVPPLEASKRLEPARLTKAAQDIAQIAAEIEVAKREFAYYDTKAREAAKRLEEVEKRFHDTLEEMKLLGSTTDLETYRQSRQRPEATDDEIERSSLKRRRRKSSLAATASYARSSLKVRRLGAAESASLAKNSTSSDSESGTSSDSDASSVRYTPELASPQSMTKAGVEPASAAADGVCGEAVAAHTRHEGSVTLPLQSRREADGGFQSRNRGEGSELTSSTSTVQLGSEKTQVCYTVKLVQAIKAFSKKPRCMIMNPGSASNPLENVMATSDLGGELQLWHTCHTQNPMQKGPIVRIPQTALKTQWPEDLAWLSGDTIVVAGGHGSIASGDCKNLALVRVSPNKDKLHYRVQHVDYDPHRIDALSAVSCTGNGGVSFVSAGEKSVYLWKLKSFRRSSGSGSTFKIDAPTALRGFHHTSTINTIHCVSQRNVIYSGGADFKCYCVDVKSGECVTERRFFSRVNHITTSPVDPYLQLVTLALPTDQLQFCDFRKAKPVVLVTGFPNGDNLSKYVTPSFHPNGWTVACGSHGGFLSLWDIRFTKISGLPMYSEKVHASRLLKPLFDVKNSALYTLSTDSAKNFGISKFAHT